MAYTLIHVHVAVNIIVLVVYNSVTFAATTI